MRVLNIKDLQVKLTSVIAASPPCSDVTEVIIKFMSALSSSECGGVFTEMMVELSFWLLEPSVVTLAILISESGSVLLSSPGECAAEEPPGCAGEEDASFCSDSSSSSMTMGSNAAVGGLGAADVAVLEDAGEQGVLEGVDMSGSGLRVLGVLLGGFEAEG